MKRRQSGSLLVEIALVVAVAGVLALLSFGLLSGARKGQGAAAAADSLLIADQAVRAFVLREKRLPCPDSTGGGYESRNSAGQCAAGLTTGYLPFTSLQLEKPAVDGQVRYGVWRGAAADLTGTAVIPSPDGSFDDAPQFLEAVAVALKSPPGTALPYVAQLNDKNQHVDCTAAFDHPAFVLVVQAPGSSPTQPGCFADDIVTGARVLSVGRQELLGWAQSRLSGQVFNGP